MNDSHTNILIMKSKSTELRPAPKPAATIKALNAANTSFTTLMPSKTTNQSLLRMQEELKVKTEREQLAATISKLREEILKAPKGKDSLDLRKLRKVQPKPSASSFDRSKAHQQKNSSVAPQ